MSNKWGLRRLVTTPQASCAAVGMPSSRNVGCSCSTKLGQTSICSSLHLIFTTSKILQYHTEHSLMGTPADSHLATSEKSSTRLQALSAAAMTSGRGTRSEAIRSATPFLICQPSMSSLVKYSTYFISKSSDSFCSLVEYFLAVRRGRGCSNTTRLTWRTNKTSTRLLE